VMETTKLLFFFSEIKIKKNFFFNKFCLLD